MPVDSRGNLRVKMLMKNARMALLETCLPVSPAGFIREAFGSWIEKKPEASHREIGEEASGRAHPINNPQAGRPILSW